MAMESVAMVVLQQRRLCLEAQRNEVRVCYATAPQLWSLRPAGRARRRLAVGVRWKGRMSRGRMDNGGMGDKNNAEIARGVGN
jgi:hypothetical protein